jgi:hypothetical protein
MIFAQIQHTKERRYADFEAAKRLKKILTKKIINKNEIDMHFFTFSLNKNKVL